MKLVIATAQFPVSADIDANFEHITAQMAQAKKKGADVIHFCEGAMSGYATIDFENFDGYDWDHLRERTSEVMVAARDIGIRVLLGSAHPLTGGKKPHNSVYVIESSGRLLTRYDKMFCASDKKGSIGELSHFTPGDHFTDFAIKGVRCGILVCHEFRYPELFRQLKRRGVEVIFHSFHAGNSTGERLEMMKDQVGSENVKWNAGDTLPEIVMPATMQGRAANNYVWLSCANTSARESQFASFVVRPDGVIVGRLKKNVKGVLITEIDTSLAYYDSTADWRDRAIDGIYHSGDCVRDPRSQNLSDL